MKILKRSILSADEVENEGELSFPEQEFDSAKTSINSKKLPAVYRMIQLQPGTVGVDFGGGRWDSAVEYLKDQDVTLCVYDPYNRSAEHNREVLRTLRANGGADFAINSNVLNVIKEPEARKSVLENIKKITKSGAPIYITVYEGRGDAKEGVTKSGYQLNRKTADYIEEIQEVFPDAKRKGKLIMATNKGSADSSVDIKASSEIVWDDLDWNQQIQLMKKYIRNYKGTKIFEDFADYVNKPVEDIIDSFSDAESYGDIRIPERKQIDSEYRNDDIYSSSSIQARNYGGAYDVDPEQYFTREDLVEFAQDVIDDIANSQDILLDISELSIDGNTITLGLTNEFDNGGFEDTVRFNVDMRKIRKPSDLMKYTMPVAMQFINAYQTAVSEDIDSSSKIKCSQSYLDRIDELMEQGLDEETASREAYAEFYPDKYDPDDYDDYDVIDTSEDISSTSKINVSKLEKELKKAVHDVMISPEFSFPEDEIKDYTAVEIKPYDDDDGFIVEVRAELSYDGLWTMKEACDPIVQKYDDESYFDMEDVGIMQAYVRNLKDVKSSQSASSKYNRYMKASRDGQDFSIHYTEVDTSPGADPWKMFNEYKATVSEIHPYDDAEYAWAQIENGVIKYIQNGKVVDKSYYMNADDWDIENNEWCDSVINEAMDALNQINSNVQPRIIHNSTSTKYKQTVEGGYNDVPERRLDPPEYDEPSREDDFQEHCEFSFNVVVTVDRYGRWEYENEDYSFARNPNDKRGNWYTSNDRVYLTDATGMVENLDALIETMMPAIPGKYRISGDADIVFDVSNLYANYTYYPDSSYDRDVYSDDVETSFNLQDSKVSNFKFKKI